MAAPSADYSPQLQTLMGAVGLTSYRALGRAAGVSRTAVDRLRRGQVGGLSVQTLLHLSQALQVSSAELIAQFSWPVDPPPRPHRQPSPVSDSAIDSEAAQRQRFQADALACLEPWLRQWPTAVAATQRQPDLLREGREEPEVRRARRRRAHGEHSVEAFLHPDGCAGDPGDRTRVAGFVRPGR